jgi:hypothetical protein
MAYALTVLGSIGSASTSGTSLLLPAQTIVTGDHVYVWTTRGGASTETITDGTNTYTLVPSAQITGGGGDIVSVYESVNVTGGTFTFTQTLGTSLAFRGMGVIRGTQLVTSASQGVGQSQVAPTTGADATTSTNLTPATQPGALLGISIVFSGTAIAAGTGFTDLGTFTSSDTTNGNITRIEHKRLTATSAVAATFTSAVNNSVVSIAIFTAEAAAGGGGAGQRNRLLMGAG